jgi:glutamate N-acetyltransferase / amino-acid N-acetyltransferase
MKAIDFTVPGFLFSGIHVGIKKDERRDLGLIYSDTPAQVAGLFTTNVVKAAPVLLDMERIRGGAGQAIVINSGNANACTGVRGLKDARRTASLVASHMGIDEGLVFVSSTGVIGVPLPIDKIENGTSELVESLSPGNWMKTVEAIMTTDTFPKVEVITGRIKGKRVKLCGMAKGAGMICPTMATMLSFIVTDANVKAPLLQQMLNRAGELSYNRITVDGETSTNDTVLLMANGRADHSPLFRMDQDARAFQSMLSEVCQELAKSVVKDGEGATKFVEVQIKGARTDNEAKKAAYAIAHSPLVKTAFFGEDANWGRILCAVGHAGVSLDPNKIDLFFDASPIVRNGVAVDPKLEEKAGEVLKKNSFQVTVHLHQGKSQFSLYTTDLSLEYVKINGSYRS